MCTRFSGKYMQKKLLTICDHTYAVNADYMQKKRDLTRLVAVPV